MYMNQPRSELTGLHNAPYPDNPIPRRAPTALVVPVLDLIYEFFAHQSSNDSYLSLGLVNSELPSSDSSEWCRFHYDPTTSTQ